MYLCCPDKNSEFFALCDLDGGRHQQPDVLEKDLNIFLFLYHFLAVGVGVLMTDSYFSWCYVIVMGVAGNQLFLKTDGNTDQTNAIWNS